MINWNILFATVCASSIIGASGIYSVNLYISNQLRSRYEIVALSDFEARFSDEADVPGHAKRKNLAIIYDKTTGRTWYSSKSIHPLVPGSFDVLTEKFYWLPMEFPTDRTIHLLQEKNPKFLP